jgi:hypothetical protein
MSDNFTIINIGDKLKKKASYYTKDKLRIALSTLPIGKAIEIEPKHASSFMIALKQLQRGNNFQEFEGHTVNRFGYIARKSDWKE